MRAAEKESRVNVRSSQVKSTSAGAGSQRFTVRAARRRLPRSLAVTTRSCDVPTSPLVHFLPVAHSASLALSSPWAALVLFPRPSDVGRTKRT